MAGFVSTKDLAAKALWCAGSGAGLCAYTAENDPNSGVIPGPRGGLAGAARATPAMARAGWAHIAAVTDRKLRRMALSPCCAGQVHGAAGDPSHSIFCSDAIRDRLAGCVRQDMDSGTVEKLRPRFAHWSIFLHSMPFNVSRAFDQAKGHDRPRIWAAERDLAMWRAMDDKGAQSGEIAR